MLYKYLWKDTTVTFLQEALAEISRVITLVKKLQKDLGMGARKFIKVEFNLFEFMSLKRHLTVTEETIVDVSV